MFITINVMIINGTIYSIDLVLSQV